MKKVFVFLILLNSLVIFGQEPEFGELTDFESGFRSYEKDTTAHAVYLYEKGENYFEVRRDYVWLIKKYHAKIKILDKQGFSEAEISIPYYHSDNGTERVNDIRAITHTNGAKHNVMAHNVFDVEVSEHWSEKRFTFSNVQNGSILEYTYEIQSPFFYNLNGWDFQDDIPKIHTEYNAKIPGNYIYNRSLLGNFPLDVNEATIKKSCFSIPGTSQQADCEVLRYVMEDVPAFKSDEEYMLAPSNYKSRLEFELSEYQSFRGVKERYTKSWKDVDKEFRTDGDIGGQLRKKNYFERNLPLDILAGKEEDLTKAKNLYNFVKSHYSWNGKFGIFRDNKVKKAFDEGVGNVAEINITLINLLNAAGMDADLMLLSTRAHGLPKKSHPVMSDFNYVVAKLDIDGTTYLLDATEKQLPFGMLPYRCLNYYGRVMDLDGESYWFDIEAPKGNSKEVMLRLNLNFEEGTAKGNFDEISRGYEAYFKNNHLASISNQEYLDEVENSTNGDFYINEYNIDEDKSNENMLMEHFTFELENLNTSKNIYFNPFLIRFFQTNPFKSSERNYPVDFGYWRNYKYMANIKIPEGYRIKDLPENNNIALPGGSGVLRFNCSTSQDNIIVFFNLQLRSTQYKSEGYAFVKELFEQAVTSINQSYLVFEKE
ncbi:MAG: DUF3857 domain-containing protein [Muricauda sp.]|nr:DUF3857 domain-containing protein [Allomuricauda sp.]MBA4746185.1 DUF3857 domain-containing protein [Allomuricauda sp.]